MANAASTLGVSLQGDFEEMGSFRLAVAKYSLVHGIPYKVEISKHDEYKAVCPLAHGKSPNEQRRICSFRITAYKSTSKKKASVKLSRTSVLEHSLECYADKKSSTVKVLKELFEDHHTIFKTFLPKDLQGLVRADYGVEVPYHTCWKAIRAIDEAKQHVNDASFQYIESFFQSIVEANPGTVTGIERREDNTFLLGFLCPRATQEAFPHCLPIVIVDACHLKSKYEGMIMTASAMDGEKSIVPLALSVVPGENEATWTYFFTKLKQAIPGIDDASIVIMSDREKGLRTAIRNVLPNAIPGVCVWHLEKNVNKEFKTKFEGRIWAAAKAKNYADYEKAMNYIRNKKYKNQAIGQAAYEYLLQSNPKTWATVYFPTPRFSVVTSNSAESMNSTYEELRNGSYMNAFILFVDKISTIMFERRQKYEAVTNPAPPSIYRQYKTNLNAGRVHTLTQSSETCFQVKHPAKVEQRVVHLDRKSCSCGEFQENCFPCRHACKAINNMKGSFLDYIHPSYKIEGLRNVYRGSVLPVPLDRLENDNVTLPPPRVPKRGRPRERRLRSSGEINHESRNSCGHCHQKGHNQRTCPNRGQNLPALNLAPTESDVQASNAGITNNASGQKRRKRRSVQCAKCGANHYPSKTPCRANG